METSVSVFVAAALRLIHQPCFWLDVPRLPSRNPAQNLIRVNSLVVSNAWR
jgi:hypothetical protein